MNKQKQTKQAKSIFDVVKQEDRDLFFNSLVKKVRNLNKKLKDIEKLEEEQKSKVLKQEQLDKIASKDDILASIKDYERIGVMWSDAQKDAVKEQQATIIHADALTIVLEHFADHPESVALLCKNHPTVSELVRTLHPKITNTQMKKDGPWKALSFADPDADHDHDRPHKQHQHAPPQHHQQNQTQEQPPHHTQCEQPILEQPHPEPSEAQVIDQYVLTKVQDKSAQKRQHVTEDEQREEVQEPQVEPVENKAQDEKPRERELNREHKGEHREYREHKGGDHYREHKGDHHREYKGDHRDYQGKRRFNDNRNHDRDDKDHRDNNNRRYNKDRPAYEKPERNDKGEERDREPAEQEEEDGYTTVEQRQRPQKTYNKRPIRERERDRENGEGRNENRRRDDENPSKGKNQQNYRRYEYVAKE